VVGRRTEDENGNGYGYGYGNDEDDDRREGSGVMKVWRNIPWLSLILLLAGAVGSSAAELKVICASRAEVAPVIDGVLDEACWQNTEVRADFTTIGTMEPASQPTTVRWVYDDRALYLGLQFHWDNQGLLEQGVKDIVARHGADQKQPCAWQDFTNLYGAELFIDKGATRKNFYQILFNPAGQFCGHYNNVWERYTGAGQVLRSTVKDGTWTAEFVYPATGMKPRDTWGFNLARNSDTGPYAIWKQTGGAFNAPEMFGTLIIGSYREWWDAVWGQGTLGELDAIAKALPRYAADPTLAALYATVRLDAARLDDLARRTPVAQRAGFETLYEAYEGFHSRFARLQSLYDTHRMLAP
jgi:hypothetical protein